MNKINIENSKDDKDIILEEDSIIIIKNSSCKICYSVRDDIKVFEYIENSNIKMEYLCLNNFILNIFSFDSTLDIDANLDKENILLNLVYSSLNIKSNSYTLNINHNKSNTKSLVYNSGFNFDNNTLDFIVNAYVPKSSDGVSTNQINKILFNKEGTSSIKPNLLIYNDDIEASHSAYLGDFKKEELFYLNSRGIDEDNAKLLLIKSFLIGNMDIGYFERNIILEKLYSFMK